MPPASALPILSRDYWFLGSKPHATDAAASGPRLPDEGLPGESPVLVMWERRGKGLHAHKAPAKGTDYEHFDKVLKLWASHLTAYATSVELSVTTMKGYCRIPPGVEELLARGGSPRAPLLEILRATVFGESAVRQVKGRVRTPKANPRHHWSMRT